MDDEANTPKAPERPPEGARAATAAAPNEAAPNDAATAPHGNEAQSRSVGSSAAIISACVIVSRVTGFFRTWAMAFALGSTFLASSYQVANNLPNMLYELVVGGMIVTAFLPVYVSVRKRAGQEGANRYASNLLGLTMLFLGAVALACTVFAAQLIYTQSFMSDQGSMETAVFFFRFFAIQILFYGVGAIVSGILNAARDYFWSSIAPAANNVIVIATFAAYALVAPQSPELALYIIAIGNPLGVFVQMAMQIPALRRCGVRIRLRIDFHDPYLRETLGIGIPAIVVMATSFCIVSVQNAVAYDIAGNGPSIIAYARLWFTLPYAFLAVPITTAMFTELAEMQAEGDMEGFMDGVVRGTRQIVFMTVPFALYLITFAFPLVTLYHAGAFTEDAVRSVAIYLMVLAVSLPLYSVNTYLQKIFSSLRQMGRFAALNICCAVVQVAFTVGVGAYAMEGSPYALEAVAAGEAVFFAVADVALFASLRKRFGHVGARAILTSAAWGLLLGAAGAAVGAWVIAVPFTALTGGYEGSIALSLAAVVAGGTPALAVTFGAALALKLPGAQFLANAVRGLLHRG